MRTIPGFPNYSIFKDGRVWSNPRCGTKGGWLKPEVLRDNYFRVRLFNAGVWSKKSIHRLVLETYIGPCPEGMECRHLDGNPLNNNLENLQWETHHNNILDKTKHGTQINLWGEEHPLSKITKQDVRMIVYMYRTGLFLQREIAEIYQVCKQHISDILKKKKWKRIWVV